MVFLERYFHNKDNVKKHFDEFAASKGFDPLVAENWYSFTAVELREVSSQLYIFCN